eukprot:gb/GEZN01002587.1/.p1 GENE.gb/GEZN01002587.1/~~gb/GEZN01002587.1/.p1  ORF type:complete len:749 (+),score=107.76 gb/GEZN01002587.1/:53-2299(+)
MGLSEAQRLTFLLAVIFLCASFLRSAEVLLGQWRQRRDLHVLQLSRSWILLVDILMAVCYVPFYFYAILFNYFPSGAACQTLAFFTLTISVLSAIAFTAVAYFTFHFVTLPSQQIRAMKKSFPRKFFPRFFFMLASGMLLSTAFLLGGRLGPYRGLYCCCSNPGDSAVIFPLLFIFSSSLILQIYYYRRAQNFFTRSLQDTPAPMTNNTKILHFKLLVSRVSINMSVCFYVAWGPMMLTGIIAYVQGFKKGEVSYPIGLDVIAVLCVKAVPYVNVMNTLSTMKNSTFSLASPSPRVRTLHQPTFPAPAPPLQTTPPIQHSKPQDQGILAAPLSPLRSKIFNWWKGATDSLSDDYLNQEKGEECFNRAPARAMHNNKQQEPGISKQRQLMPTLEHSQQSSARPLTAKDPSRRVHFRDQIHDDGLDIQEAKPAGTPRGSVQQQQEEKRKENAEVNDAVGEFLVVPTRAVRASSIPLSEEGEEGGKRGPRGEKDCEVDFSSWSFGTNGGAEIMHLEEIAESVSLGEREVEMANNKTSQEGESVALSRTLPEKQEVHLDQMEGSSSDSTGLRKAALPFMQRHHSKSHSDESSGSPKSIGKRKFSPQNAPRGLVRVPSVNSMTSDSSSQSSSSIPAVELRRLQAQDERPSEVFYAPSSRATTETRSEYHTQLRTISSIPASSNSEYTSPDFSVRAFTASPPTLNGRRINNNHSNNISHPLIVPTSMYSPSPEVIALSKHYSKAPYNRNKGKTK